MPEPGRNSPCPCGSGKKYKQCCQHRREGGELKPLMQWSYEKIDAMSTQDIFGRLNAFGIPMDAERFIVDAPRFYSACDLADHWWQIFAITAQDLDEDFPWMACVILWKRLLPDIMNSERLDGMMQQGYAAMERNDAQRACTVWLDVWDHLTPRFTPPIRSVHDAEKVFSGLQCLFNWCQDFEIELGNAGLDTPEFNEARIRYCTQFCELLPDSDASILLNMKQAIAESLFRLGRSEEADRAFEAITHEFPQEAFAYIGWGDIYHWNPRKVWPVDYDKAERIYRLALENNVDDRKGVLDCLKALESTRQNQDSISTSVES